MTLVRMTHRLPQQPDRLLDPGPPPIAVRGQELHLVLPGVGFEQTDLPEALRWLARQAEALHHEAIPGGSAG